MPKNGTDTPSQLYRDFIRPRSSRDVQGNNTNDLTFHVIQNMYRRQLMELCMNRFHWENLPEEIDARYLEMCLLTRSLSAFFFDADYNKYFAMSATPSGFTNYQDMPTAFTIYGNNYPKNGTRRYDTAAAVEDGLECVPIWGNYLRRPDLDVIEIYAHRLAKADETIDINMDNSRTPILLAVDENSQLSASNIMNQIRNGSRTVQVNSRGTFNMAEAIQAVPLGGDPQHIEKLDIVRTRIWNQCMNMLGLNSANQDKKERLVASEVSANDEQIDHMKAVNLNARQEACKRINKQYGLDVWVEYVGAEHDAITLEDMAAAMNDGDESESEPEPEPEPKDSE